MMWKHTARLAVGLSLALGAASAAAAQDTGMAKMGMEKGTTMVGGQAMFPSKDIVDNAVNSADHTTLVAAVKAAGLVETLKGAGPFTVFAPTNAAFGQLPAGTVDTLLKPENKAKLAKVLTYHVVAGRYDAAALMKAIKGGRGQATLKTVQGEPLTRIDERRPQHRGARRQGRRGRHHDLRRGAVERRDPRGRQGAVAKLMAPASATSRRGAWRCTRIPPRSAPGWPASPHRVVN